MAEPNIQPLRRAATFASLKSSPDPPPSSAVRHRIPQRQISGQNGSLSPSPRPGTDRRRSSLLSFSSIDEVTQSLSDDLINPSMSKAKHLRDDDEVSAWHSTPLAFAILPAIGGIFFKNGTAFVTDILLLGLAAIFMNWSVRLPWDWYYSAQAQVRELDSEEYMLSEEVEVDETAIDSAASSAGNSPKQSAQEAPANESGSQQSNAQITPQKRQEAAAELRKQETLALVATFLFPVMAAYLLHAIRSQLSSSSTALVSDFNLSIFVLAAEVRPFQQLIRLLSSRTLHLQRIVTEVNDPLDGSGSKKNDAIKSLESRIDELETLLAEQKAATSNGSAPQRSDVVELVAAEMKKRADPRFDALERAMRRYEKRSTTLSMLTEQRLNSHESRIQDSLSLAAQAAQRSQNRGAMATVFDNTTSLIGVPFKLATELALWPFRMLNLIYAKLRETVSGRRTVRPTKKASSAQLRSRDEKARASERKSVR